MKAKKDKKSGGFYYDVEEGKIIEYIKWSPERKLKWLYAGNLLEKQLPKKIKNLHKTFRRGEK
ncbi:MAG: hypothetical protein AB1393_10140 [Candidatus Edwardsbacteria bacterium]